MNKKVVLLCAVLLIAFIDAIVVLVSPKDEKYKLSDISLNGIKLNDKATKKMKQVVEDASFAYEYDKVGFSVDENDKITEMVFYSYESTSEKYGINELKAYCGKKRLTTVEDFEEIFGEGEKIEKGSYVTVNFSDDSANLSLTVKDGVIINIYLELS